MRPWHCGSLPPLCVVSESRADDLALIRHRIGPERVLDHRQKSTFGSCSSSTRWTSEGLSGTWLSENDAKALKDALASTRFARLAEHKFVRIAQAVTGLSR